MELLRPLVKEMVEVEVERAASFRWSWVTVQQAARLTGLSAAAIRNRVREGSIPHRREEGRILIDMKAWDEQMRQLQ